MNENKLNSSPALTEDQDRKKIRRAALIKMGAMLAFVVVVLIFGSMHAPIIQMTV